MNLLERLRQLAEALPPGAAVSLPREWLLEELRLGGSGIGAVDLTVVEAGQLLGRRPSTVRGMCAARQLEGAYRLHGREWRVPRSSVTALLAHERELWQGEAAPSADRVCTGLSITGVKHRRPA
jgi:hypothetical protein